MFPRSHPSPVAGQLSTSSQSTPPTPTTHLHWDLIQACAATKASNIVPPSPRTRHTIGVPSMDTRSPSTAPTPTSASALMNGSNRIGMNGPPPPPPPIPATTPRGQPIPTLGINSHHRRQLSHARIPPPPPPPPLKMPPSIPVSSPSLVAASPRHSSSFQFPSPASLLSSPNTAPSPRHGRKPSDISIPPTPSSASRIKSPPSLTIDHTRSPSQMGTIKILPPPLPANLTTVPPTPSSKLPPPLPRATCGSDPLPPPTPSSASISSIASTSQPPAQTPRKLPPPLPRAIGGSDPSPPASMASSNEAKAMAATRVKIEGEILSTEATYLANLNHLVSEFIVPLRTRIMSGKREDSMGDLDEDGVNRISLNGNLETLTNFHSLFFQELSTEYQRALNNPLGIPPNLARIFIKFADYFKMYTAYLNSYEACVCEMEDLRENDKFQKFVREFMLKTRRSSAFVVPPTPKGVTSPTQQPTINGACPPTPSGGNGLPVTGANLAPMDYFIQPVQRLLRYALLLQQLLKHSPPSDVPTIQQALTSMETIANFVNERKRSVEAMNKILQISSQISGELPQEVKPLIQPFRKLLKEGPLQIITENKIMGIGLGSVRASSSIVRLFTDLILWTNSNNKYKGYLDLNTAGVIRSDQDELIFQVSDCKTSIWCRGSNLEETRAWRDLFESTITQLQQEKDAARRRQRVAKARSNNHTHRLKLGTLIKEKLGEIPGASNMLSKTVLDLSSDLRSNDSEAASMIESDPQLQSGWLEKEAAAEAKRQREKLQSTQTSTGTVQPPMMSVFGTMPKEVIAQLKLQQLKLDPSGSGGSGGSSSTCTTVTGSLASSAQSSRRTSSNSANDNSNLKPMLMSTPSTDSIPSSTDCPSSTSSRSHSPSHTRTSTNNSTSAISSATFHQHSPSTVEEDEDRDITGNSTDQS